MAVASERVRKAAAKAAVTASEKTGRPVDPRVASLVDGNSCPRLDEGCPDCNQLVAEKQELRDKLRYAYVVVAERQQRLEDDERNMRAARRQLELFMDDGIRERVTVALALLDESVESRNEAWFDFTEQRGQ